jgi:hypothetical protein
MAKMYDIVERLKNKNEKPFVRFDKDHCYTIDTGMAKGFNIMALSKKADDENNKDYNDEKFMMDVVEIALGKEALEYIKNQEFTMDALALVMETIMSAYQGKELAEEKEKKSKK